MNYLTEIEAAKMLKISVYTLARLRRKEVGPPFIKIGGAIRYIEKALHQWAEEQQTQRGA